MQSSSPCAREQSRRLYMAYQLLDSLFYGACGTARQLRSSSRRPTKLCTQLGASSWLKTACHR